MIRSIPSPGNIPGFFCAFCLWSSVFLLSIFINSSAAQTLSDSRSETANLIIIIDDLGNNRALGERSINLPGSINLAFLPHTPFARSLAEQAHQRGHGIMLHAPMANKRAAKLGPGAMTNDMNTTQWQQTLRNSIDAIPHVQGVNNHMGSLLTEQQDAMSVVMAVLQQRGLFFIDSMTTPNSVAYHQAHAIGLPYLRRDIFLDHVATTSAIAGQFNKAIQLAKQRGIAVIIGHPYPQTLDFLEQQLPLLKERNIRLHSAHQYLYDDLWRTQSGRASRYQLQPFTPPALQATETNTD